MKKSTKLFLMFFPLALLLIAIATVVYDLKNPLTVTRDDCKVLGTGKEAHAYRTGDNLLYDDGAKTRFDIAFDCEQLGAVVINDRTFFSRGFVEAGNTASLRHREYRVWPSTWRFQVESSVPN